MNTGIVKDFLDVCYSLLGGEIGIWCCGGDEGVGEEGEKGGGGEVHFGNDGVDKFDGFVY